MLRAAVPRDKRFFFVTVVICLALSLFFAPFAQCTSAIIYVSSSTGQDEPCPNCGSEANPYRTLSYALQAGLSAAAPIVAIVLNDSAVSCAASGVSSFCNLGLTGGTGSVAKNVSIASLARTSIDCSGQPAFLTASGWNATISLVNLDIRNCTDHAISLLDQSTAALVNCTLSQHLSSTPDGGAALYLANKSSAILQDTSFSSNVLSGNATFGGGAIRLKDHSEIFIGGRVVFSGNSAPNGGAIFATSSSQISSVDDRVSSEYAQCLNLTFQDNWATAEGSCGGGAVLLGICGDAGSSLSHLKIACQAIFFARNVAARGDGGAIAFHGSGGILTILGSFEMVGNRAPQGRGGALFGRNHDISVNTTAPVPLGPSLVSYFANNSAGLDGGAWHVGNGFLRVFCSVIFDSNSAGRYGGAVSASQDLGGSDPFLVDVNPGLLFAQETTFQRNVALQTGGALNMFSSSVSMVGKSSFEMNVASWRGGAIFIDGGVLLFTGSSVMFASNVAFQDAGGAVGISSLASYVSFARYSNLYFFNNSCGGGGGALAVYSSVVFVPGMMDSPLEMPRFGLILPLYVTAIGNRAMFSGGAFFVGARGVSFGHSFDESGGALTDGGVFLFLDNVSQLGRGGAVDVFSGASIVLRATNILFFGNSAVSGGSLSVVGGLEPESQGTVWSDCAMNCSIVFANNSAQQDGGALRVHTGAYWTPCDPSNRGQNLLQGLLCHFGGSTTSMTFVGNVAGWSGGALSVADSSGMQLVSTAVNFLQNRAICLYSSLSASLGRICGGGALSVESSSSVAVSGDAAVLRLVNNVVDKGWGGGVLVDTAGSSNFSASLSPSAIIFDSNMVLDGGGGGLMFLGAPPASWTVRADMLAAATWRGNFAPFGVDFLSIPASMTFSLANGTFLNSGSSSSSSSSSSRDPQSSFSSTMDVQPGTLVQCQFRFYDSWGTELLWTPSPDTFILRSNGSYTCSGSSSSSSSGTTGQTQPDLSTVIAAGAISQETGITRVDFSMKADADVFQTAAFRACVFSQPFPGYDAVQMNLSLPVQGCGTGFGYKASLLACSQCSSGVDYSIGTSFQDCHKCPPPNTALCQPGGVFARRGFWLVLEPQPAISSVDGNYRSAMGGLVFQNLSDFTAEIYSCSPTWCAGTGTCGSHRDIESPLCGRCLPGYAQWSTFDGCMSCEKGSVDGGLVFALILVVLAFAMFHHIFSQFNSGTFRILVYFLQSLSLTVYPEPLYAFFTAISFQLSSMNSQQCPFYMSPVFRVVANTLFPLLLVFCLVIYALLFKIKVVIRRFVNLSRRVFDAIDRRRLSSDNASALGSEESMSVRSIRDNYLGQVLAVVSSDAFARSFGLLSLSSYQVVLNHAFFFYDCRTVANQTLMSLYPDVLCDNLGYRLLYLLYVPLTILVAAFSLLLPVVLYRYIYSKGHVPPFFMVMIEPYRPGWRWLWECVLIFRKVLLITFFVAFLNEPDLNYRRTLIGIVHALTLALHQFVHPYKNPFLNHLETVSLSGLVIASFAVGTEDDAAGHVFWWTAVLAIVTLMFVVVIVHRLLRVIRQLTGRTSRRVRTRSTKRNGELSLPQNHRAASEMIEIGKGSRPTSAATVGLAEDEQERLENGHESSVFLHRPQLEQPLLHQE